MAKDTLRAWKADLAEEPENPAGLIELSEGEMELVAGGHRYRTRHHHRHHHCHHTRHHHHRHCHRH